MTLDFDELVNEAAKALYILYVDSGQVPGLDSLTYPWETRSDKTKARFLAQARTALEVFLKQFTPTSRERTELDALRKQLSEFLPRHVAGEAIVNHRVGFWNITESYPTDITTAHIELADEQLELYVQHRIAEARADTAVEVIERKSQHGHRS